MQATYRTPAKETDPHLGILRAIARGAPEGMANSPEWTAWDDPQGSNPDVLTGSHMMAQREEDRQLALGNLRGAVMNLGSPMAGLSEALYHNDTAANIGDTGGVMGKPRTAKYSLNPHSALLGLQQVTGRK